MNSDDLMKPGIIRFNRNSPSCNTTNAMCRIIDHRVISDDYVNYDKNVAFITALRAMNIKVGAPAHASTGNDGQSLGNAYGNNNLAKNENTSIPSPRNASTRLVQRQTNYGGPNVLNNMAMASWASLNPGMCFNTRGDGKYLPSTAMHTKAWYGTVDVDLNKLDALLPNGNPAMWNGREAAAPTQAILVKNHLESPALKNVETHVEEQEPDYPELCLDLRRVKQRQLPMESAKSKRQADDGVAKKKGASAACRVTRVTLGKPIEPFVAKYSDPVERELEKWHNSHNSTLRWKRLRRGHYKVNSMEVELLKLNGTLYVKGHGIRRLPEQVVIQRFAQYVQNMPRESGA